MDKRILIMFIVLTTLLTTSCAPFKNQYNNFNKDWVNASKKLQESQGVIGESFYNNNNIRKDMAHAMKDNLYLVYYYTDPQGDREDKYKEVVEKYKEDPGSLEVYLVENEESYIEFISRSKDIYTIEDVWYDPYEIDKLPYRLDRK